MKQQTRRLSVTAQLVALLLLLSHGFTASGQSWPATSPSLSELPIPAGVLPAPTTPDWVNCDMFSYLDGSDTYQLLAVTYDDLSTNTVYMVVYDSKTGLTTPVVDISNARHPDIVIGQTVADHSRFVVAIAHENLNTGKIDVTQHEILNARTLSFSLGPMGIEPQHEGKNPHIDMGPDPSQLFNGFPTLCDYYLTYQNNNGGTDQIFVTMWSLLGITCATSPSPPTPHLCDPVEYIADGIRPDIACKVDPSTGDLKLHFVYYKSDFTAIKHAEADITQPTWYAYSVAGINTMENNFVTFTGYPRIDASNIIGSSNTPWHAVAECTPEGAGFPEIHGYNYTGSYNIIDYGHPLGYEEYSPTVTVASGDATIGNPADVGNAGYTVGWNLEGYELNALYLDEANTNTVWSGYDQVNKTPLSISGYGTGKNLFAMTSSSNSGQNLAAAWWDGSDIKAKLVGNTFAFKPTEINMTSGKQVRVHPNPASNQLFISGLKKANYSVTNLLGAQISFGDVSGSTTIDISQLPVGTYILSLTCDQATQHIKFIKE